MAENEELRTLQVDDRHTLVLDGEVLVVQDKKGSKSKSSRICGVSTGPRTPAEQRIPLYNILWIEIDQGTGTNSSKGASQEPTGTRQLLIDYAHPTSKDRLVVRHRKFDISSASDPTDVATRTFITQIQSRSYGSAQPSRRAFVLVNPHAGPGGADKIWSSQVRPIFEAARWQLNVIRTAYGGQARELVRQLEIDKFDVIVPCSGDGLPHEVFNGLGDRPDARQALEKIAVAHIPCGSGNALSLNLNGTHRPSLAALAIVKGIVTPMDLVSITQEVETDNGVKETKRSLSFLSQALGFIAELDLGTEHLRFLSDGRFAYGAIKQLVFGTPIYPVDLAVQTAIAGKEDIKAHYREYREKGPARVDEDEASHTLPWVKRDGSSTVVDESGPSTPATEEGHSGTSGLPPLRYGTAADKLPHGWEMVPYDKIGLFYAGNMGYVAPDLDFFPAALMNDGLLDVMSVDGDIGFSKAYEIGKGFASGGQMDLPLVGYRKVVAYRVIPRHDKGYLSIDGEKYPFAPFQAEVHRGLCRVISRRGIFEAPPPKDWETAGVAK